jgi:DNA-binding response OmpR family regulator
VLILSGLGQPENKVRGLGGGADDYLTKPFSPAELVARVEALHRRLASPSVDAPAEAPLVFDGLIVDPAGRRVVVDGTEVELTQREFDLLAFLARSPGRVYGRDQLMDAVWGFASYTDTSTVTVHVRRVRAKIEPDPSSPVRLQTVWGVGYRFSA